MNTIFNYDKINFERWKFIIIEMPSNILDYPEFLESSGLPELPLILTPTQSGYEVSVDLPAEKLHFSLDHTGIIR